MSNSKSRSPAPTQDDLARAEQDLKYKYHKSNGYAVEIDQDGSTHIVFVFQDNLRLIGEGETKDQAYKELFYLLDKNRLPVDLKGNNYQQAVFNAIEAKWPGSILKGNDDGKGKYTVKVRKLIVKGKGEDVGEACYKALHHFSK